MPSSHIDILLLTARPAAGKSEIIHFLKNLDQHTLLDQYHLAPFKELDDFPMIWTWFEEDDQLEKMGKPRIHSDEEGYFLYPYLWDVLIRRLGVEYDKLLRDHPDFHHDHSAVLEFARGSEHGGYRSAFKHVSENIASRLAILYINVSFEESLRKNRARFNPEKPDSILQHSLPDEKMDRLYHDTDWQIVAPGASGFVEIAGYSVPFVVMENEDDVTTKGGRFLAERLQKSMANLWLLYNQSH